MKKLLALFLSMMAALFAVYLVVFFKFNHWSLAVACGAVSCLHLTFLFGLKFYNMDFIRISTRMYLVIITIFTLSMSVIFYLQGCAAIMVYFFLPPMGAIAFVRDRRSVLWGGISMLGIVLTLLSPLFFSNIDVFSLSQELMALVTQVAFASAMLLFIVLSLALYTAPSGENLFEALQQGQEQAGDEPECQKTYREIIRILEEEKPYCDPGFSPAKLASMLNCSTHHILNTLKQEGNTDFVNLVNTYRIDHVKVMFEQNIDQKYNMQYIYTSVGFRHQPTFNQVFKKITGLTPSEYISHRKQTQQTV
ncbi:MAG: helix-turn-helix domain-containing protein [Prevotellaceae bacterium]|jgi:AraC-like DNA-binding protein|nr:helix-turn-helix domain-containing protein [Prevotellaceae bacterium]